MINRFVPVFVESVVFIHENLSLMSSSLSPALVYYNKVRHKEFDIEHCFMCMCFHFSYLAALGKTRTAQVHRDARIGEAESKRDAGIKEAIANQERLKVKFENDTKIAEAKRDYELKKAAYDMEVC